jgi:hypothetical protein
MRAMGYWFAAGGFQRDPEVNFGAGLTCEFLQTIEIAMNFNNSAEFAKVLVDAGGRNISYKSHREKDFRYV